MRGTKKGTLEIDLINTNWIKQFMQTSSIVSRIQTGKLQPFKKKTNLSEVRLHIISKPGAEYFGLET